MTISRQARFVSLIADAVLAEATPPAGKLVGKFVLIADREGLNLVLGLMADYPYHAALVEHFCRTNGIASAWVKEPDVFEIHDREFRVRGGGWVEIDRQDRSLRFSGESRAYGEFCRADLNYIVTNHSHFSAYSITVV